MKILRDKFEKTIETDQISFSVLREGKVQVESIKFKVVVQSSEPIDRIRIGQESSGIDLKDWFGETIGNSLLVKLNFSIEEYFEKSMLVYNDSIPYIVKTLFQILEKLLPSNLTLISLEYD